MRPLLGWYRPHRMEPSVLLPDPDLPTKQVMELASIIMLTLSMTVVLFLDL